MNWSVHQYHTPRMGTPKTMPVQGKSGSVAGFHMFMKELPTVVRISPQPPSSCRPKR